MRPTSHSTLYNWGIALGDLARHTTNTVRARALWKEACGKYRAAVECDAARSQSTQALNNWGLALQQLATLSLQGEKFGLLADAVERFREAIRRDPGFHRAVYNLGTIMYALSELAGRRRKGTGGAATATPNGNGNGNGGDAEEHATETSSNGSNGGAGSTGHVSATSSSPERFQTAAALYICCAQALDPRPVYASSLRMVRRALPLPALVAGHLLVAPPVIPVAPGGCWRRRWFMLDHEAFWTAAENEKGEEEPNDVGSGSFGALGAWASIPRPKPSRGLADVPENNPGMSRGTAAMSSRASTIAGADVAAAKDRPWGVHVHMEEVSTVAPCADASLPSPDRGFYVGLRNGRGHFFVAESVASRDLWVDALTLVQAVASRGRGANMRVELRQRAETAAP